MKKITLTFFGGSAHYFPAHQSRFRSMDRVQKEVQRVQNILSKNGLPVACHPAVIEEVAQ